jgi:hypothetical protein
MTTSRTLRTICNDRLLFREIAERTTTSNSVAGHVEWQDAYVLLSRASLSDTIRIAYAAERATKRGDAEYPHWEMKPNESKVDSDLRNWLPHLIALRHPTCLTFRPEDLLTLHYQLAMYEPEPDSQHYANILDVEFCMIALILQQISQGENFSHNVQIEWKATMESREAERKRNMEIGILLGLQDLDTTPPGFAPSLYKRMHCLARDMDVRRRAQASAVVLHTLFTADEMHTIKDLPIPFPEVSRMPFHTWMNIPMVYGSERRAFYDCHMWWASTPQFVSGTWIGYYSDERVQNPSLDEPMHSINLIARKSDLPNPGRVRTVIDIASQGRDGVGKFTLHGHIRFDGNVLLTKRYDAGWEWIYKGFVTPFGIAGSWGDRHYDDVGYFWLWKKDWCNPEAKYPQ